MARVTKRRRSGAATETPSAARVTRSQSRKAGAAPDAPEAAPRRTTKRRRQATPAPRGGTKAPVDDGAAAKKRLDALCATEVRLTGKGFAVCAGVDEAGRGPLAGPVVAAACHVPQGTDLVAAGLLDVTDSKKLGKGDRERLFAAITACPGVEWATASVSAARIDEVNILQASMLAMHEAVASLPRTPDAVLVDGPRAPWGHPRAQRANGTWREADPPMPDGVRLCQPVIKGDGKVFAIAAASIIAKVTRDRVMDELDAKYPGYGFAQHAGYPTRDHVAAIRRLGPCPVHRMTFAPLKHMHPKPAQDAGAGASEPVAPGAGAGGAAPTSHTPKSRAGARAGAQASRARKARDPSGSAKGARTAVAKGRARTRRRA